MAKRGSLWYALHAPRKVMITESNSTERGSENRTPSAHMQAEPLAGPAAFSAVCVCLARGEEVCPAPWGFCCCLVGWLIVLFCFYTFGCKTCAEPPECVLSKRAPPLHDLCIRVRKRACACACACRCACRCAHVHRAHARASSCGDGLCGLLSRPHTPSLASRALGAGESMLLYPPNSCERAVQGPAGLCVPSGPCSFRR